MNAFFGCAPFHKKSKRKQSIMNMIIGTHKEQFSNHHLARFICGTYLYSHNNDKAVLCDLVVSDSLVFVLHDLAICDQLLSAGSDSVFTFNFVFQIAYLHKKIIDKTAKRGLSHMGIPRCEPD